MDVIIDFNEAAFWHGCTTDDICQAMLNWMYDDIDADKYYTEHTRD